MVKVLVIGAHHGLGAEVVRQARERGLEVTPFEGDILDGVAVASAVRGQDAIISTLGPRRDSPPELCSRGTQNLLDAMRAHGVRRLVQVTGALIGHPRDRLGLFYRLLAGMLPRAMLRDRREQERLVVDSGLDWTVIRPTRLTNQPARGRWRSSERERVGALAQVSRVDVADALVSALGDDAAIGRSMTLQY